MRKRLRKKLLKTWLNWVIDASQRSHWRKKLFEAEEDVPFRIDVDNCAELSSTTVQAIKKYRLRYLVATVSANEAPEWLSAGGMIIFKFWSPEYPQINALTGNNPRII